MNKGTEESKGAEHDSITEYLTRTLNKDHLYYHCVACGLVAVDKNFTKPLFGIVELFGCPPTPLPTKCLEYNISGGICGSCLDNIRKGKELKTKRNL